MKPPNLSDLEFPFRSLMPAFILRLFPIGGWKVFRYRTCHGLWKNTPESYDVLIIFNDQPGNGAFKEILDYFESICKRDGKSLRGWQIWNQDLKRHLIEKNGFSPHGKDVVKKFLKDE